MALVSNGALRILERRDVVALRKCASLRSQNTFGSSFASVVDRS